ncbi:hypothetical protein ACS0TY_032530 [Phlomoides rotata]
MGGLARREAHMVGFRNYLEWNGLVDLGWSGFAYTWTNNQSGIHNVQERRMGVEKSSDLCGLGRRRLEDDTKELEHLQPTTKNVQRAWFLENRVACLLRKEEIYWHQRSRVCWMRDGDKNTRYFHHITNGRKKWNHIASIEDADEVVQSEDKDIERILGSTSWHSSKLRMRLILQKYGSCRV